MESPIWIVTLGFDSATFDRLQVWRKHWFPPERNFIPAHLSLYHRLTPAAEPVLVEAAREAPFALEFEGVRRLSGGFAIGVDCARLQQWHARCSARLTDLSAQDRQPFRPHVTVMNKAPREEAEKAFVEFQADWQPFTGRGVRLLIWEYLGGPWRAVRELDLHE